MRKPCREPACPFLVQGDYCEAHARLHKQEHAAVYGSKQHAAFRAAVLSRDKICQLCRRAPATIADHIVPLRCFLPEQQAQAWDPAGNGQGLCSSCHQRKRAREAREPQGSPDFFRGPPHKPTGRSGTERARNSATTRPPALYLA